MPAMALSPRASAPTIIRCTWWSTSGGSIVPTSPAWSPFSDRRTATASGPRSSGPGAAVGSAQGSSGVSGVVGRAACDIRHPGISVRTA